MMSFDWLRTLDAALVLNTFVYIMLVAFFAAMAAIVTAKHPRFQQFAPNLLTTLGILGTFVGIAIGLANFNAREIDQSIETLLEGLKTAFVTSIVGMGLSIITRSVITWVRRGDDDEPEEVSARDIHAALIGVQNKVARGTESTERLRTSIAGDGDSTVVTQLQKLRTEVHDSSSEIRRALTTESDGQSVSASLAALRKEIDSIGAKVADEFRRFADQVSEIGSKQLVKALEEVIRDFNAKLTEQFGENFKRLDDSVRKLVEWQDAYKNQLEQMDQQFKLSVRGLIHSRDALGKIAEHSDAIPQAMTRLEQVMQVARRQLDDLEAHLAAFAEVKDRATEAMPEIKARIEEVMTSVRESVKRASDHYEIMLTDSAELIGDFRNSGRELHKQFVDSARSGLEATETAIKLNVQHLESGGREIQKSADKTTQLANSMVGAIETAAEKLSTSLGSSVKDAFEQQNQRISQLHGALRDAVQDAASQQNELITELTRTLDDALQKELQRSMEVMANSLARITGKFVEDYTLLTDRMSQVVERGRSVPS